MSLLSRIVLSALAVFSFADLASAATVKRVQRGVHDGFELVILHCDTLPEFSLIYDQVKAECRLEIKGGIISPEATGILASFLPRQTLSGAIVDRKKGVVVFKTKTAAFIREHLVNGPPALILDFSYEPSESGRFPFELDREEYLKLGGRAERAGKLDLALSYIDHIRSWGEDNANLTHRAGVIEQKLGRWDMALETFAKSAADPELAADAHARRTMIYMGKGDTLASGQEWAGFFHKKKSEPFESDSTALVSRPDTTAPSANTQAQSNEAPPKTTVQPRVIEAGGGDGVTYLYYGWGLLAVGLMTLIGLWAASGKSRRLAAIEAAAYRRDPSSEQPPEYEFTAALRPRTSTNLSPRKILNPDEQVERMDEGGSAMGPDGMVAVSSRVVKSYCSTPPPAQSAKPAPSKPKPPVEQIIELAESGASETEIASSLMVGRDEVSMVLNLARLARRRAIE